MVEPANRYRVILADDTVELRSLVRRMLERTGRFDVVGEAGDGAQAVELARAMQPDLAVFDLAMPVLDGLEALPLVRDAAPGCCVVVVSGFDADRIARIAVERGAKAYLAKGVTPQRLVAELLAVLQPPAVDHSGAERVFTLRLGVDLTSPRHARRVVARCLSEWGLDALQEPAELLVSELVANAIAHAHSPSQMTVRRDGDFVRFALEDWGPGALVLRNPTPQTIGGRGLQFVERIADRWGTASTADGKTVWFDLATDRVGVVQSVD